MADPFGAAVRRVIRAYHGSPYDFDRFDASKIGKGEGSQAFGHGLYFAGNEATARSYSESLGLHDPQIDAMVQRLNDLRGGPEYPSGDEVAELVWQIQNARGIAENTPGRMYEVEIGYPEEALLDWDAPMSKQPAARQAISEIASHLPMEPPVESMLDRLARDRTGANLYSSLENSISENMDAWSMPDQIRRQRVGGEVSKALLERGVPGIRYLDQGSRAAGEGTRNYVMFPGTEDSIRILRKYGLLAPVATGAAMEEE